MFLSQRELVTFVSDWFQMKKHMQDLSSKISRQGLNHNELW